MHLSAGRVALRPLAVRDASTWSRLRRENAEWLGPWESTRPPESASESGSYRSLARDLVRQARAGRALPFAVTYDGVMVGQLTVTGITWGSARWAQMGYWVTEGFAGRGIITTAVALACDHCLFTMRLHRIEIAIRPENTSSLRVVDKLGFRTIGMSPKYLHINGMWRDHMLFAITAEEITGRLIDRVSSQE